jgi:hypothetical protein
MNTERTYTDELPAVQTVCPPNTQRRVGSDTRELTYDYVAAGWRLI